ncbi:MAG: hypothetical protein OEZ09_04155 [Betaproteobacteria bacterium]|nr:hypothetical protein [Betaproteobacteria bacterium]MDH5577628.1 hypothetical protein [Betaproteobacteria bacterium]
MPGGLRLPVTLALAAGLFVAHPGAPALAAAAQVTVEVPEGKTKTVRLRKLPRGAVIGVAIVASGKLRIALVSANELKSKKPEALFRGALDRRLSFRVVIPESSDYYLVLDNRRGSEPVKTTATISAQEGAAKPPSPPPARDEKMKETRAATRPQA